MDISRRTCIENLMGEKKHAQALIQLSDTITSLMIERVSYSNDDFVWAISQRSICFRHLGQFPFAYEDARSLIKKRPTLAVGYLRKAEVELEVGLTEQAVGTLSLWQHKRPTSNGDNDGGTAEAIQMLRSAREKHRSAMSDRRRNERAAKAFGYLAGAALGTWLCAGSCDRWMVLLCVLLGFVFSYLCEAAVQTQQRSHENHRRGTLVDLSEQLLPGER